MKKPPKKRGLPQIPIHGQFAHNSAFLVSIGNLVVNWANNESVFLAMLQCLISGGKDTAAVVWFSHRTTLARIEMVNRLCKERLKDKGLIAEVHQAMLMFKGFSRTRNFYCHAMYRYDSDLCLASATGATAPQDDEPIRFEVKRMDAAALNEMADATIRMGQFNRVLWTLVDRIQKELGVQRVAIPELPAEPKASPPAPS